MALPERADVVALPARRGTAAALLAAIRPRQWTKNLLVFAGILFAAKLGDAGRWIEALTTFVAFSAASSAAYLLNDLRDYEHDRRHPVKRLRPIARGELSPAVAEGFAFALAGLALALTVPLGASSVAFLACFVALQVAYTFGLKHVVLVDVIVIAGLFVIRAAAGAAAVEVRISPWLLLCSGLLALFLALAKRRGELVLVGEQATPGRPVLDGYSLPLLDQLVTVVAASTLLAYSLYTFSAHSQAMMGTIPFVLFGLFRYLLLIHRRDAGEEPENVLVSDGPILVTVALWAATAATILVVTD